MINQFQRTQSFVSDGKAKRDERLNACICDDEDRNLMIHESCVWVTVPLQQRTCSESNEATWKITLSSRVIFSHISHQTQNCMQCYTNCKWLSISGSCSQIELFTGKKYFVPKKVLIRIYFLQGVFTCSIALSNFISSCVVMLEVIALITGCATRHMIMPTGARIRRKPEFLCVRHVGVWWRVSAPQPHHWKLVRTSWTWSIW